MREGRFVRTMLMGSIVMWTPGVYAQERSPDAGWVERPAPSGTATEKRADGKSEDGKSDGADEPAVGTAAFEDTDAGASEPAKPARVIDESQVTVPQNLVAGQHLHERATERATPPQGLMPSRGKVERTTTVVDPSGITTYASDEYEYEQGPDYIPYHPNRPRPEGYHVEELRRTGLIVGGSVLFGIFYGTSVLAAVGSDDPRDQQLLVPVVGPFLLATEYDEEYEGSTRSMLVLVGMAETAGAALLAVGVTQKKKWYVRNDAVSFSVSPATFGRSGYGVGAVGTF